MQNASNNHERVKWIYHKSFIEYYLNIVSNRFAGHMITKFDKPIMTESECDAAIYDLIMSGDPFAVAKVGGTEARTIADVLYTKAGGKIGGLSDKTLERIINLSGFFPDDKEKLFEFVDVYIGCCEEIDVLAVWNVMMQKYYAEKVAKNAKLATLYGIEPFGHSDPWTRALKGKRVTVIHPFAETIESQYKKRESLFDNKELLPKFELRVVKAVQTIAGRKDDRFKTWFEALDYMKDKALSEEFDIALIGCGAYGLPLTAALKRAGKQAVHLGGALQLLFGIKGRRWDNGGIYKDSWVRPGVADRIDQSEVVENSCYW